MKHTQRFTLILMTVVITSLILGVLYTTSRANALSQQIDLDGTSWVLVPSAGEDALAGHEVTLHFSEGAVNGMAHCNGYRGAYTNEAGDLTFGPLMSTMMACPGLDQEGAYMDALAAVRHYRVTPTGLVLSNAEGEDVLTFEPMHHTALEGTAWQLTAYNTGSAISSLVLDTEITALFEDGQLGGAAGCNRYFAAYTTDGTTMTLGPAASTEMFCAAPEGVMEQEAAFLDALNMVATYQIEGDNLTMFDREGTRLLEFTTVTED